MKDGIAISRRKGRKLSDEEVAYALKSILDLDVESMGYELGQGLRRHTPHVEPAKDIKNSVRRGTLYTANVGGNRVGMGLSSKSRWLKGVDNITDLRVDPAHRGRGVGRELLKKMILDMVSEGRRPMLTVNLNNPAGLHLYKSMGFRPVMQTMVYDPEKDVK